MSHLANQWFEHQLHELLDLFRGCKDSRELERHAGYREHAKHLEALTQGVSIHHFDGIRPHLHRALRLVHWNIERGKRFSEILRTLQTHVYLKHADVLILTEADIGMARSQNRHIAEEIAKSLGYHYLYVNSYLCLTKGIRDELESEGENQHGLHGVALLTRYPVLKYEAVALPELFDKMVGDEKRLGDKRALLATLDMGQGKQLCIGGIHLDAKSSPKQRCVQLRAVLQAVGNFVPESTPVILGGDLNTTTYNTATNLGLFFSCVMHLCIRGTRRSVEVDYLHPYRYYESLFKESRKHGFDYESWNEIAVGTMIYDQMDPHLRNIVLEYLPMFAFKILCKTIERYGGRTPMKVDWFLGRGAGILGEKEINEGEYESAKPRVIRDVNIHGPNRLSDHFPIGVDVRI